MATMDKVVLETEISSVTVLRSSAAERNKGAILQVLQGLLGNETGLNALEIASGRSLLRRTGHALLNEGFLDSL